MKRYEYFVTPMPTPASHEDVQDELDQYGEDGWLLCGIEYGAFILARELTEEGDPEVIPEIVPTPAFSAMVPAVDIGPSYTGYGNPGSVTGWSR